MLAGGIERSADRGSGGDSEPAVDGESGGNSTGLASRLPLGAVAWLGAVVLWVTMQPFLPRRESWEPSLSLPESLPEVGGNFLLLLPLALILAVAVAGRRGSRRSRLLLWLFFVGVGLLIETGQILVEDRIVSPYDLMLNLAGAALGQWMGFRISAGGWACARRAMAPLGGILLLAYLGLFVFLSLRADRAREGFQIREWDPKYPILAGDEVGGERTYEGTVTEARICVAGPREALCATDGADGETRRRIVRVAEATQSVRLEARVRSRSSRQSGPTRILTFSAGPDLRNVTLGQSGEDLILRIRTPLGGRNGTGVFYRLPDALPEGQETRVTALYGSDGVMLSAATDHAIRSTTIRPTTRWLWTWAVAGQLDQEHPLQALWAGLAGALVVLFPAGMIGGWAAAGTGRGRSLVAGVGAAVPVAGLLCFLLGSVPDLMIGVAAVGTGAFGAVVVLRDREVWWPRYMFPEERLGTDPSRS